MSSSSSWGISVPAGVELEVDPPPSAQPQGQQHDRVVDPSSESSCTVEAAAPTSLPLGPRDAEEEAACSLFGLPGESPSQQAVQQASEPASSAGAFGRDRAASVLEEDEASLVAVAALQSDDSD
ncbi:unnamed protein product [Prorocentrum cordatum]|nr:unnamed protein product [Polarella glacialis]